jgi:hypothetical protein
MASEEEHEVKRASIDRRRMLKMGGAAVAGAWVAPVILTSPVSAAATSTVIPVNPVCDGQTCGSFTGDCFPSNPGNCLCYSTPNAQGICETNQSCADLAACPNGQSDCPAGTVCIVGSCCGAPVCIVLTNQCGNLPPAAKPALQAPTPGSGPTTGHR